MEYVGKDKQFEINKNAEIGSGSYGKVFECQSKFGNFQFQLCAKVTQIYQDNKANQNIQIQSEKDMNREKQITEIVQKNQGNKNLVQIYHVEYIKEKSCLVMIMEKCTSNLDKEWKEKKIYSDFEVIDFLKQFLNGYRALYESNVIHRDIKPENILIQKIGQEKFYRLADFGLGRIYKLNDFKLTKSGTPVFASPELNTLLQDEELDRQFAILKKEKQKSVVDIYSLGILLHLMVTGVYPFETNKNNIKKFLRELKNTPFKLTQTANPKLINLIERMIVYDPDKRMTFDVLYDEVNRLTTFQIPKPNGPQANTQQNINFQPINQPNSNPIQSQNFQPIVNGQPNVQPINVNFQPINQPNSNPIQPQNFQPINQPNSNPIQPQNFQPIVNGQPNFQPINQSNLSTKFQSNSNSFLTIQPNNQIIKPKIQSYIQPNDQIQIINELTCYISKILQIHKNTLDPKCKSIFEDFVLRKCPQSEIVNLYNNFDKTLKYSEDELQFYYCLKYGQKGQQYVNKVSYQEQLRDLSN